MTQIAFNRKATHDYFLSDKMEAGIALLGCEVKSIREGRVNLKDSFVRVLNNEAWLMNCHISPYSKIQGHVDIDPTRTRKLLLHRDQINRLMGLASRKGYTVLALALYFKKGRVKVEIALGKGKKEFDKREAIKRRIHDRESAAAVKAHTQRGR